MTNETENGARSPAAAGDRRRALGTLLAVGLAAGSAGRATAKSASKAGGGGLDQLLARAEIEEVLFTYARGNDRNDIPMIQSCFWPDSTHKHGGFSGTSHDFIAFASKILDKLKLSAHFITNVSIRVNGDRAFSECYYFAHHRRANKDGTGEEDAFFEGRYLDFHERRDNVWKISRRRGLSDLSLVIPATTPYADWPAGQHSLRDKGDDYYRMLAEFEASA